jgi:hypothetical protein
MGATCSAYAKFGEVVFKARCNSFPDVISSNVTLLARVITVCSI